MTHRTYRVVTRASDIALAVIVLPLLAYCALLIAGVSVPVAPWSAMGHASHAPAQHVHKQAGHTIGLPDPAVLQGLLGYVMGGQTLPTPTPAQVAPGLQS